VKEEISYVLKQNAVRAAKNILGAYLCRRVNGKIFKYKIVETEAYGGRLDRGSHAYSLQLGRIRQTARNAPMWAQAGTIYVYFTYGMHYMLNIVTGEEGLPSAVLIRGLEGVSGPARLTKKLKIDKKLNGKMLGKSSGLWIEKNNFEKKKKITGTPRIGIAYAGPVWSKKLHRFLLRN
jgi:DNA-3-methyladenine glycosylase